MRTVRHDGDNVQPDADKITRPDERERRRRDPFGSASGASPAPDHEPGTGRGLVLCATTGHGTAADALTGARAPAVPDSLAGLLGDLWRPEFPSPEMVNTAAGLFERLIKSDVGRDSLIGEGPTWRITIGPGLVQVGTRDYARAERTHERQVDAHRKDVDMRAAHGGDDDDAPDDDAEDDRPARTITSWSRKSRARMVKTLCALDYAVLFESGALPAMITLTAPGDWLAVLPDKDTAQGKIKALVKRFRRSWGRPLVGLWKLEFQRRGAPHWHILMAPPHGLSDLRYAHGGVPFREWLSATWTDLLDPPDPEERRRSLAAGTAIDYAEGLRASDPRRVAAYFTKHGLLAGKEYQHNPPAEWLDAGGTGRWWGRWGLPTALAIVEVTPDTAIAAARVLRRYSHAQRHYRVESRPRVRGGVPVSTTPTIESLAGAQYVEGAARVQYRRTRVRQVQLRRGRGWLALNDAPSFAADLARYLASLD